MNWEAMSDAEVKSALDALCLGTEPAVISTMLTPDRPAGWWAMQVQDALKIEGWRQDGDRLEIVAKPVRPLGMPEPVCAVENDVRLEQARVNCLTTPLRLVPHDKASEAFRPLKGRAAHLLCSGPSLRDTYQVALEAEGADIFTTSVAHEFIARRGAIGSVLAHIDADPREHKGLQINPVASVQYWLASCCHPSYVRRCVEAEAFVWLWHAYNGESSLPIIMLPSERRQRMIVGGGSTGLRAMSLLYYLGYREIHVHGMDGCYSADGADHVEKHLGKNPEGAEVMAHGRWFLTTGALLLYSKYFFKQLQWMPDANVHMHGDGLTQHLWRSGVKHYVT